MIEIKIKELLETWFTNIQNWETNKIYFNNNYELQLIRFEYGRSYGLDSLLEKEIQNICNKYSTYYVEPEIRKFDQVIQIQLRYFTKVK